MDIVCGTYGRHVVGMVDRVSQFYLTMIDVLMY